MPDNWECYGLVMEFIDGPLLSDLLSDSVAGKLPIAEQAELVRIPFTLQTIDLTTLVCSYAVCELELGR